MESSAPPSATVVSTRGKPVANGQNGGSRILIVDDEESILWSLSRTLSHSNDGYLIGTARSAEEALEILKATKVDVLLTDLKLPKMNGLDLTRNVKKVSPNTRAILMTAYGNDVIFKKANEFGCVAYIEKPFAIDRLVEYIDSALHPKSLLKAELVGLHLSDVVQLYALKKLTVALSITSETAQGVLLIEQGVLTHAEFGGQMGPDALLLMLKCRDANVRTLDRLPTDRRTLSLTWNDLRVAAGMASRSQQLRVFSGNDVVIQKSKLAGQARPTQTQQTAAVTTQNEKEESSGSGGAHAAENVEVIVGDFRLHSIVAPAPKIAVPLTSESGEHQLLRAKSPMEQEQPAPAQEAEPEAEAPSFSSDELVLKPEPSPPPEVRIPTKREERLNKLRGFVNAGIEHFKNQRLEEAKHAWILALRIDPNCEAAKKNLEVLESIRTTGGS